MDHPSLSPQTAVADLLDVSPHLTSLLLELRVDCLGCLMNRFCTLEELCNHYELEFNNFIRQVRERLDMYTD